jgi:hypothetical protein
MRTKAHAEAINKVFTRIEKDKARLNALTNPKYAVLGDTCWASDSNKIVFECWCPQCKEVVACAVAKRDLPWWAIPEVA